MVKTKWVCEECSGRYNRCVIVSHNHIDTTRVVTFGPDQRCPWKSQGGKIEAKWKRVDKKEK